MTKPMTFQEWYTSISIEGDMKHNMGRAWDAALASLQSPAQEPSVWVDRAMTLAQEFASSWSLVGWRFDSGDGLAIAEAAKAELRAFLESTPLPQAAQPDHVEESLTSDQQHWFDRGVEFAEKRAAVDTRKEQSLPEQAAPGVPEGFRLEKLYEPERIKVEKIGGGFCCFCKTGSGGVETAAFEFLNAMLSASPSLATERDAVDAQKVRNDALAGFDVGELADVAEGLENGYEKTVNVGNVTGEGDAHLETATAYAARFIRAYLEAALQSQPASAGKDAEDARRWISITDRLPEPNQVVCLVGENRWRNTGGDFDVNVHACGYLASVGHQMYWSCFSEPRGLTLDAFTHWTPVPAISAIAQQESGK